LKQISTFQRLLVAFVELERTKLQIWMKRGKILFCFKFKTHTFEVLGGFGFWHKTFEKSFGFGQNLKNPRN